MKAAETLTRALYREAERVGKLGYHERAHELRDHARRVGSASSSLEGSKRLTGRVR